MKKPKIKIVGITNNLNLEDIEADIIMINNLEEVESQFKAIPMYENKTQNTKTVVIETLKINYREIIYRGKLYVGCQSCKIYDDYGFAQCFNIIFKLS